MYRLVFVATRKRDEVARKILIMHTDVYAPVSGKYDAGGWGWGARMEIFRTMRDR
jgi:hypothetical protein